MFVQLADGIRQLLFPDNCLLCRTYLNSNHREQLCRTCAQQIRRNTPPFCTRCSRHLDYFSDDSLCETCRSAHMDIDRLFGCCRYEEPLTKLIHSFKYHGKTSLYKTFVKLMTESINLYHFPLGTFDLIAPIPLHPVRLRERGYNQSELLSKALSAHYGLRHESSLLLRVKPSPSQTLLSQKQRFTNTLGAFKMNPSVSAAGKRVLLVDDLITTQATANAAARALKNAGAAYAGIIALAIT